MFITKIGLIDAILSQPSAISSSQWQPNTSMQFQALSVSRHKRPPRFHEFLSCIDRYAKANAPKRAIRNVVRKEMLKRRKKREGPRENKESTLRGRKRERPRRGLRHCPGRKIISMKSLKKRSLDSRRVRQADGRGWNVLAKDFRVTALFREDEGRVGADIHELVELFSPTGPRRPGAW